MFAAISSFFGLGVVASVDSNGKHINSSYSEPISESPAYSELIGDEPLVPEHFNIRLYLSPRELAVLCHGWNDEPIKDLRSHSQVRHKEKLFEQLSWK